MEDPGFGFQEKASTSSRVAAALLNASGVSAGYLYLRRWRRAAVHLVLTAALVVAAYVTGAAARPLLWIGVFAAWIAWMVWDGWRLSPEATDRSLAARSSGTRGPLVVAVLLIIGMVAGFVVYGTAGRRAFAAGLAAHRAGECETAIAQYQRVTTVYELTLSSAVTSADANSVECMLFLTPGAARRAGDFAGAVDRYHSYQSEYPSGLLTAFVSVGLADTYRAWATSLRGEGRHLEAISVYERFLGEYANTAMAGQIRADLAGTRAEYANALTAQAGAMAREGATELYLDAIEQYVLILREYADTPAAREAPGSMIATYNAATQPLTEQRFCDAVPALTGFAGLTDPEAGALAMMAGGALPQALYDCGIQSYKMSNFRGAVDTFARLAQDYPDNPLIAMAKPVLIAAKIADLRGQQPVPGELPLPPTGSGGPTITLEVFNYSPSDKTFLYSGPSADEVVIPACQGCVTYSSFAETPDCVPDNSKPKVTLRIPSGMYETVGYSPSMPDQEPFSSSDTFDSGFIHAVCYYDIRQSIFSPVLPIPRLPSPVRPL